MNKKQMQATHYSFFVLADNGISYNVVSWSMGQTPQSKVHEAVSMQFHVIYSTHLCLHAVWARFTPQWGC